MVQSVLRRAEPDWVTHAILAEASEAILFNHDLLRTTLENVTQGIGMFDADACLAAWNRRFLGMLNVPEDHAQIGTPLSLVFANYLGPAFGPPDPSEALTRNHRLPDGRFLELQTNPMKSGGLCSYARTSRRRSRRSKPCAAGSAKFARPTSCSNSAYWTARASSRC